MSLARGDVVLLNFPFSSGAPGKVRPAVVVQSDHNNRRLTNTIVAMITSRTDRAKFEPTQLQIELNTSAGAQSGLLHSSTVKCENLFTVEQAVIRRVIGHLTPDMMKQIDDCLRASLALTG